MIQKPKVCRICHEQYLPRATTQKVCSPRCAIAYSKERYKIAEEKIQRRELKRRKTALETKPQLTEKAQRAFNWFIKERDHDQPCISCGKTDLDDPLTGGRWDAGHFFTVGAHPFLRYSEMNCHRQCKHCNDHLGGNHQNYERGLAERWGQEALDLFKEEAHRAEAPNHTHDDLRKIAADYRARARVLKRSR